MPNSEVKRRSADGSVGSPHVRVGNRQASNKAKGPVERLGLLLCYICCLPMSALRSRTNPPGADLNVAQQRPEGSGQDARHHSQASNKTKGSVGRPGFFVFCGQTRRQLPRWRCAYRGYRPRSPEKVRSTASGESSGHINVNERPSRVTGPFVFLATEPKGTPPG